MMRKKLIRLILIGTIAAQPAMSAILVSYLFNFNSTNPTTVDPNASAVSFNSIGGPGGPFGPIGSPPPGYSASGWAPMVGFDPARYLTISITVNPGFEMDLTSLDISERVTPTGPTTGEIRYSVDGFASSLGTGPLNMSMTFTNQSLPLNDNNLTGTIEFRLYASGAANAMGAFQVDNIVLNGTILPSGSSVPEPSTFALLAGSGILIALRRRKF
ncbi:MAG: PEP-CTERM sorting domain-containing protein [Verrucomicrobiota bacterium]